MIVGTCRHGDELVPITSMADSEEHLSCKPDKDPVIAHGTPMGYHNGCRCVPCSDAGCGVVARSYYRRKRGWKT